MGEFVVIFFVFAAVIIITAVIFGGWLVIGSIRLIFRVFGLLLGIDGRSHRVGYEPQRPPALPSGAQTWPCPNERCRAANPLDARFCRRCGTMMPTPHRVQVRRAAMW
jgi:hypothetical protein